MAKVTAAPSALGRLSWDDLPTSLASLIQAGDTWICHER